MFELARALTLLALAAGAGCYNDCILVREQPLAHGGLFVAHVERRGCEGCEMLDRGNLIWAVDGELVSAPDDLDRFADGRAHQLTVRASDVEGQVQPTITIEPGATPIRTVDAALLRSAPYFARRNGFARVVPQLLLIGEGGEPLGGLDLLGQKHVVVLFDWAAAGERQDAALTLQVLQKAQADLLDAGIHIVLAQVDHYPRRGVTPMGEADLREFFERNQISEDEGGPLPAPPLYRAPTKVEERRHKATGVSAAALRELLGEPPNILLIDERGIIRWHSAGALQDPEGRIPIDMVYTINAAVLFALDSL